MSEKKKEQVENAYTAIEEALTGHPHAEQVKSVLYGPPCAVLPLAPAAAELAAKHDFELRAFALTAAKPEEKRAPRKVRVGAAQFSIVEPTTAPVTKQYEAIMAKTEVIVRAAGAMGVNVLCLQEAFTAPFFFCLREKHPWLEFAESAETGPTVRALSKLAKQFNMVIIAPILERDSAHQQTIWNTAVVISNGGNVIGKHRKMHIPRVGDFNESTYYSESTLGHNVFETAFGNVAINICYGRHFPQNWQAFGRLGAEIVFNPSATVDGLSETLWPIEARNAAIANSYFTVGINRVGTESFASEFTSGDGKPAHRDFGHFYGSSYATGPNGQRTPPLSRTRDGLLVTECDLNLCQQIKDFWVLQMAARDDVYAQTGVAYARPDWKPVRVVDPALDHGD